ncbi:hypothetical protein BITS_1837 [Bifidobacterium tsurumiense]|uniref:Uncharacterized protein n=1 Tax=Bifidobacterium tsurumiense TaxID=356829 RepID=A0A087EE20_9BIFI|nr:hypothetical protein BITS_1837 [Bifidobacterium tsurumiense]
MMPLTLQFLSILQSRIRGTVAVIPDGVHHQSDCQRPNVNISVLTLPRRNFPIPVHCSNSTLAGLSIHSVAQ